jgi:hypothetical protein
MRAADTGTGVFAATRRLLSRVATAGSTGPAGRCDLRRTRRLCTDVRRLRRFARPERFEIHHRERYVETDGIILVIGSQLVKAAEPAAVQVGSGAARISRPLKVEPRKVRPLQGPELGARVLDYGALFQSQRIRPGIKRRYRPLGRRLE